MVLISGSKIHFIGIGGVSMNALARFCMLRGACVSGSDRVFGESLKNLREMGADVYEGENPAKINMADAVIFSSAIQPQNSELKRARELKKTILERHEFLSEIALDFDIVLAVGGTHGKTTVTAMIAHILKALGANAVAHIGGEAAGMGSLMINEGAGPKIFVTEACEYKRHLLSLKPDIAVVTNIECDHPDCYDGLDSVKSVFARFVAASQSVIVSAENRDICDNAHMNIVRNNTTSECRICKSEESEVIVLSDQSMDIWQCGETEDISGYGQRFVLRLNGEEITRISLPLEGGYNRTNAIFAVAAACRLGYGAKETAQTLSSFGGVARRFERAGMVNGAALIFDYAHHPTEIACALEVARKSGRTLAVFQPHTYSRTAKYLDDFVTVLGKCDALIIMPTYAARENTENGADSRDLFRALNEKFSGRFYITKSDAETVGLINRLSPDFDNVLCLGAGDIYNLKNLIAKS